MMGNKSSNEDSIKQKTEQSVREMNLAFERNRNAVLQYILNTVQDIKPKEHENLR